MFAHLELTKQAPQGVQGLLQIALAKNKSKHAGKKTLKTRFTTEM